MFTTGKQIVNIATITKNKMGIAMRLGVTTSYSVNVFFVHIAIYVSEISIPNLTRVIALISYLLLYSWHF